MILREIRLNPFAGIDGETIPFEPGLNVLLGPNEAGKSTIVSALRMALFTSTDYRKKAYDGQIMRFMPLSGSDTIRVDLDFYDRRRQCHLSKSWGKLKQSELKMTGKLVTDPNEVQDMLEKLLGFGLHTFDTAVCASQSSLANTMNALASDTQTLDQLTSIMRQLILETDGVSIEQLDDLLSSEYEKLFAHWDPVIKCPMKNRGIENPWKQEVGLILKQYYQKETIRQKIAEIKEYYQQIAEIDKQTVELTREFSELQDWVKSNEPLTKSLREYSLLEEIRMRVEAESRPLADAMKEWPELEAELKSKQEIRNQILVRIQLIVDERAKAEQAKATQEKITKYNEAAIKKVELDTAKSKLKQMIQVRDETYKRLTGYTDEMDRIKAKLEGGQLSLALTAKKPLDLLITKDLEAPKAEHLENLPFRISAGGKLALEHTDWSMEITSGTTNFEKLQGDYQLALDNQNSILKELGVAGFAEAKEAHESYQVQARNVDLLNAQFEQILAGDSYDELEKIVKLPENREPSRSIETISVDLATTNTTLEQLDKETKKITKRLAELAKEYTSYEHLVEMFTDKRVDLKATNANLEKLAPIPKDIRNPKEFIEEWESRNKALATKQDDRNESRVEKAKIEALAPSESEVDLIAQLADAEASFEQVVRKGNALINVRQVFDQVRQATDSEPLGPWIKSLSEILMPITSGRFGRVNITDNVPSGAIRTDGVEVPFDILSCGTRVGLGLALRLSMAERFLQQEDGFIVLDDPMVDMDPERQVATANVLQAFGKHKQVIVVTCHPEHAKLVGGNVIDLHGPTKPDVTVLHAKHKAKKRNTSKKLK